MRSAFRGLTSLLALAIVVQVGLAGYGAFDAADGGDDDAFDPHSMLGYVIVVLMVVVVVLAAATARDYLRAASILLVLGIVQVVLAFAADDASWIGFLHGANALAVAALAGALAGRSWRERRVASTV
jgi:hypothetical protein